MVTDPMYDMYIQTRLSDVQTDNASKNRTRATLLESILLDQR